jgi:hypothetical protein
MYLAFGLLLLAGNAASEAGALNHYDDYGEAYRAAQQSGRPLLVILNPAADSSTEVRTVSIEAVRKTKQCRESLNNYVVAVIDTGTEYGMATYEVFKSPQLPRIVVIDKQQKFQIFRTSNQLQTEGWASMLSTYRNGERQVRPASQSLPTSSFRGSSQATRQPMRDRFYCPT